MHVARDKPCWTKPPAQAVVLEILRRAHAGRIEVKAGHCEIEHGGMRAGIGARSAFVLPWCAAPFPRDGERHVTHRARPLPLARARAPSTIDCHGEGSSGFMMAHPGFEARTRVASPAGTSEPACGSGRYVRCRSIARFGSADSSMDRCRRRARERPARSQSFRRGARVRPGRHALGSGGCVYAPGQAVQSDGCA